MRVSVRPPAGSLVSGSSGKHMDYMSRWLEVPDWINTRRAPASTEVYIIDRLDCSATLKDLGTTLHHSEGNCQVCQRIRTRPSAKDESSCTGTPGGCLQRQVLDGSIGINTPACTWQAHRGLHHRPARLFSATERSSRSMM